jgi:protoheme ferro-lyase
MQFCFVDYAHNELFGKKIDQIFAFLNSYLSKHKFISFIAVNCIFHFQIFCSILFIIKLHGMKQDQLITGDIYIRKCLNNLQIR